MCNRSQALDTLCGSQHSPSIKYDTSKVVELEGRKEIKIIIGVDSFGGSYNDHEYFNFQLGNLRQL